MPARCLRHARLVSKREFAAQSPGSGQTAGLAHPCGTPALRMPSKIRSFPARKIGLSLSWPARKRWIVKVGSSVSPTRVSACASSSLPRFARAAARKKCA